MINVGDKFKVTQEYIDWYRQTYPRMFMPAVVGEIVTVSDVKQDLINFKYGIHAFSLYQERVALLERINE